MPDSEPTSSKQPARHWHEEYASGQPPWDTGVPCAELVRCLPLLNLPKGCRAIDLGCGSGTNAVYLAQQGFAVTGIDSEPLAIERAREKAGAARVEARFLLADLLAEETGIEGWFDFLFDRGCYHCVRQLDLAAYLRTLRHLAAPGACMLVLAGNAEEPMEGGPPVVTEEEIRSEFCADFNLVSLERCRLATRREAHNHNPAGWCARFQRKSEETA